MNLRTLSAFALVFAAACANEAANGDRNTGTALEGDAPTGVTLAPAPAVAIDTAATTATTEPAGAHGTAAADTFAKGHVSPAGHDSVAPAALP